MQISCVHCGKKVDIDSNFCKYCGVKQKTNNALNDIFIAIYNSLFKNSNFSKEDFDLKFDVFKNYEQRILCDEEYYSLLVDVIFFSGFSASTVKKHLDRIHFHFPMINTVCKYSKIDINRICEDPLMIKNRSKIEACYNNAKRMQLIINEYGSFSNFITSFGDFGDEDNLFRLKKDLERKFKYLGDRTSYHFMMDIGLNVLKPDRVILRIFSRLGLVSDENDLKGAVQVGRTFSNATGFPIRYIDIIFVLYGQMNQDNITSICTEKKPRCDICEANIFCNYAYKHIK